MNDEELLELIYKEYYKLKPKGCLDFFKRRDKEIPCLPSLQKRFGSTFNEILIKAGVPDDELNFVRRNEMQCIRKLEEITKKLGYVPTQNQFIKLGYSPIILKRYFGSYENAVKMIDEKTKLRKANLRVDESKEELLEKYIAFSNKIGRPGNCCDLLQSNEIYNPNIFSIRFGGIRNLKKKAGFLAIDKNNEKYTKGEIVAMLQKLYIENNRRLTVNELKTIRGLPSTATLLRYFQTTKMSEVWESIEKGLNGQVF